MNKKIVIPILLYVFSLAISAFSNQYIAFTPPFFAMVLLIHIVWCRQHKGVVTDADLERRKLVNYSLGALTIAPIFAGLVLILT